MVVAEKKIDLVIGHILSENSGFFINPNNLTSSPLNVFIKIGVEVLFTKMVKNYEEDT